MGDKPDKLDGITGEIKRMLSTLKYGSITIIVQDGKVVQLEKSEKVRIR